MKMLNVGRIKNLDRRTASVIGAWLIIAALFAAVTHFTTETPWEVCIFLALVMAGFSSFVAVKMIRRSDQSNLMRIRLITFFAAGLVLMLVTTMLRRTNFDPVSLKLFVFSLAGMILTAFFLPPEKSST